MDERMKIDSALVRKLRVERAWSQEHLAGVSGISLRTIQRVEAEGTASLETRMALAAAFNVSPALLVPAPDETSPPGPVLQDRRIHRKIILGNCILWAAAIVLTAIVDGPPILAVVLLPVLAFTSAIVACRVSGRGNALCESSSNGDSFTPPASPAP
jgi:transcriptional regulator with XRE-family HTH domain